MIRLNLQSFRRSIGPLTFAALSAAFSLWANDRAIDGRVELFAVLPPGSPGPEGLTVGPDGNVYVTTFGFTNDRAVPGPGHLIVFRPNGQLVRDVAVAGSGANLLGLA